MKHGTLVISLDFELLWGGLDVWTPEGYGQSHIKQVPEVIKRLVSLFDKYNVKATFATVGLLMLDNADGINHHLPTYIPTYKHISLRPYNYVERIKTKDKNLYFAPESVELLKSSPNIEVGTHTYCHYYCWEEGQTIDQFSADMAMAQQVAKENGIQLESIVFPRNQVSEDYLAVCARYGIKTYRGNPRKYFDETHDHLKYLYYRVARLLDSYIYWGGNTSHPYDTIDRTQNPMNIPASRMLRPYSSKLRWLEWLRLRRIKKEMQYAAKHNELYHLWWHPHNFGAHIDKNMVFLEKILQCYNECFQNYGMQSMTMKELYYKFLNNN